MHAPVARVSPDQLVVPVSGGYLFADRRGVRFAARNPDSEEVPADARHVPVVRMASAGRVEERRTVVSVVRDRHHYGLRVAQTGSWIGKDAIKAADGRFSDRPDTPGLSVIFFESGDVVPFYTSGRHYTTLVPGAANATQGNSFSDWRPPLEECYGSPMRPRRLSMPRAAAKSASSIRAGRCPRSDRIASRSAWRADGGCAPPVAGTSATPAGQRPTCPRRTARSSWNPCGNMAARRPPTQ